MVSPTFGVGISSAISNMLYQNDSQIAGAINKQTAMKSWAIIGVAIVAVILIVKKMGK